MLQHKTIRTMTASRSSQPPAADRPEEFGGELPAENRPASGGPSTSVGAADGGLIVAVDTREQLPWTFPASQRVTLTTGDYSIVGYEDEIAIERKSLFDLLGSLTTGRDRFVRECQRLAEYPYAALVVEGTWQQFLADRRSKMHPNSRLGSLAAISERFGIHPWFCGNRAEGQRLTERLLTRWATDAAEGKHVARAVKKVG